MAEALGGVALGALLVAFVAYGYAGMQHGQTHGFLNWIVSQAVDTAKAAVWLTEQLVPLTSFLSHELGKAFNVTYSAAARWIGGVENYIQMKGGALVNLALALNQWAAWLLNHEIPKLIKALPNEATHLVHTITTRIVHVEKTIVRLPGLTKAEVRAAVAVAIPGIIARDLPYFDWLKKHLKVLERILAGAAAGTVGALIDLPKDLVNIRKRLGKLEKTLAGTVGAAIVATALARLGVSWIRCTNWKRLGRGICGLPSSVISDILGLLTDIFILADICEVIKLTDDAFSVVEGPLASFVGNVGGALCHGDYPEQKWPGLIYSTAAPELNALAL